MSRRRSLLVLLVLAAACRPSQAQSSATAIPRYAGPLDASEARWVRGLNYDPLDAVVAWPTADTLIVAHVERYSEADVAGSTCGGSGVYAVPVAGGRARTIAASEPTCRALGSWQGFAFDPAASALYASVRAEVNRSVLVREALPGGSLDTLPTGCAVYAESPDVTADGRALALKGMCGSRNQPQWELYVVGTDGTGLRQLTAEPGHGVEAPRWSPNGRRIAYVRTGGGSSFHGNVAVLDADGSNRGRAPTVLADRGDAPAWSPDGRWIAYVAEDPPGAQRAAPRRSIRVVRADGGGGDREVFRNRERSTYSRGWGPNPEGESGGHLVWSPDGRWIAFTRGYDRGASVWRVDVRTGDAQPVTRPDR